MSGRCLGTVLMVLATVGLAQEHRISVIEAWTRATAPGQQVAGVYFEIVSPVDAQLMGLKSPAADRAELHEMRMDGNIMRMRPVEGVALPAGRKVQFKPGGLHAMLFGLKQPLRPGDRVPITLTIVDAGGGRYTVSANSEVRNLDGSEPHPPH
jgi:copper(I)-binding protein